MSLARSSLYVGARSSVSGTSMNLGSPVPRLPIGERELAHLDDRVHPVGGQVLGIGKVGVGQERELLQKERAADTTGRSWQIV